MAPRVESFSLPIKDFRFTFVLLVPPQPRGWYRPGHAQEALISTMRPSPIAGRTRRPLPIRRLAPLHVRGLALLQNPILRWKKILPRIAAVPSWSRREEIPDIFPDSTDRERPVFWIAGSKLRRRQRFRDPGIRCRQPLRKSSSACLDPSGTILPKTARS